MNIKRFFAADTRQAMQQVRKALGADAVIISNRQTDDGVEIIAAVDLDGEQLAAASTSPVNENARLLREGLRNKFKPSADQGTSNASVSNLEERPAAGQSMERMNDEINRLRNMLENQITSMNVGQWTKNSPIRIKLYNQLSRISLDPTITTGLIAAVNDEDDLPAASRKVLGLLTQRIAVTETDVLKQGGVVVLLGMSGSGKTTTLAKLAAQFIMENTTRDAVFISADNSRVGAHEQLLAYGRLFGIPVLRAREETELEEIIAATADKRLVLVDSPSLTPQQLRQPERVRTLHMQNLPLHHYLVLPATLQQATMTRLLSLFGRVGIDGCIITKADEASSLGDALSAAIRTQTPIAYWTDGQRVTAHLHRGVARDLVARALQMAKEQETALRPEGYAYSGGYHHDAMGIGY